jgi:hypothetical protein
MSYEEEDTCHMRRIHRVMTDAYEIHTRTHTLKDRYSKDTLI